MRYLNPINGYAEDSSLPFLWCLLFGPLYFLAKGIWLHAVASLVLALCTAGMSWLIYPFAAGSIVRSHYGRRGWTRID